MPATSVISFERRSQTARRLQSLIGTLPVRIYRTRTQLDFQAALRTGPFPVAVLEAEADPDLLPELVRKARSVYASIVIVGETGGLNRQMQLRESGAHCLLDDPPSTAAWQALLNRLVDQSQQRMAMCG